MAPPLFWLGQSLIAHGNLPSLARFDFETYFHRALLIAALILLWPLLRALRIGSWRGLALERNPRAWADLAIGFAIAAIPLLCCGLVIIALHIYSLRNAFLWQKMPTVLVAASIVPVLEELLFRGFILGVLLRSFSRFDASRGVSESLPMPSACSCRPSQRSRPGGPRWGSTTPSAA